MAAERELEAAAHADAVRSPRRPAWRCPRSRGSRVSRSGSAHRLGRAELADVGAAGERLAGAGDDDGRRPPASALRAVEARRRCRARVVVAEAVDRRVVQRDDGHAVRSYQVRNRCADESPSPFRLRATPCARRDCRASLAACLRTRCGRAPSRRAAARSRARSSASARPAGSRRRARRSARGTRRTSSTIFGARPSVGSSIMIRSGSPISVRQIVSICCSPPDSTPPGVSRARAAAGTARTCRRTTSGPTAGALHRRAAGSRAR